mgnify:CR=1 FL=1
MAFKVNIDKAKKKAAEEAKKAERFQKSARLYWKPKQGKNLVRILPPWTDEGPNQFQFWREIYVHWGIGPDEERQAHLSCPKLSPPGGGECPVCEEYDRLRATKQPEDLEAAKEIRARQRAFSNVVDLSDPTWSEDDVDELKLQGVEDLPEPGDPKIQIFSYGPTILKELLDIFTDEIDLTDLKEGHNVIITRSGQGLQTEYRVRIETKASAAPFKGEPDLINLDGLMPFREPHEMKAILEGLDPEEVKQLAEGSSESEETEEPASESEDTEAEAEAEAEAAAEAEALAQEEASGSNGEGEEYPPCFGVELDVDDAQCSEECDLFDECKAATAEKEAKKSKRKPRGKKKAAAPAGAPAQESPAQGKAVPEAEQVDMEGVDDLEARMKAAIDS